MDQLNASQQMEWRRFMGAMVALIFAIFAVGCLGIAIAHYAAQVKIAQAGVGCECQVQDWEVEIDG